MAETQKEFRLYASVWASLGDEHEAVQLIIADTRPKVCAALRKLGCKSPNAAYVEQITIIRGWGQDAFPTPFSLAVPPGEES